MMFMNQKEVERLRKRYPVGTVVMLDYMDDPYRIFSIIMKSTDEKTAESIIKNIEEEFK